MRWISLIWDSEAGEPPSLRIGYEDPRLPEFQKIQGGEGPFDVVSKFLVFVLLYENNNVVFFF